MSYKNVWVLQSEDGYLPDWLTDNLRAQCDCGGQMENFYSNAGRITARRCNNKKCPHMMAEKVVGMCEILKIKGIGSKGAYNLIKSNNLQSHFEAIPFIVKDKPKVLLFDFLRMCFIKGVDKGWDKVANGFTNIQEVYESYKGDLREVLEENKEDILHGAKYIEFIEPWKPKHDALITGTVMISGNIKGFNERNNFIAAINTVSEGRVRLSIAEQPRKTGVMALIQEKDTPNRKKAECALENGIPIKTPHEFQVMIADLLKKRMAGK